MKEGRLNMRQKGKMEYGNMEIYKQHTITNDAIYDAPY